MTQQDSEGLQPHQGPPVLGLRGQGGDPGLLELDTFDLVLMVVALVLLAASALYWLAICYSRSKQTKRAKIYERAVKRCRGEVLRRCSSSLVNPLTFFRRSEASRESSIYYIYSNPLPVGLREEEEEEEEQRRLHRGRAQLPPAIQELPDPAPLFYLQL